MKHSSSICEMLGDNTSGFLCKESDVRYIQADAQTDLVNELTALKAAVLKLQPVLDWVGPICNGRSDQWKADAMKEAIALASPKCQSCGKPKTVTASGEWLNCDC